MRLMLDTHFVYWLAETPDVLTSKENRLLNRITGSVGVSAVALWEFRMKWERSDPRNRKKQVFNPSLALAFLERNMIPVAPLDAAVAVTSLDPPIAHRDPFDAMLLIHAQHLGARLLTRDARLLQHPLALQP